MRSRVIIWAISVFIGLFSNCGGIKEDKEGRFIQDYIDRNKAEISFTDANIEMIYIHAVKKSLAEYIKIKIPAGTVLSPSMDAFQNMLCYENIETTCYGSVNIEVPVICINLDKKVPEGGVSFTFKNKSDNPEINAFIKNLSQIDIDELFNFTEESIDHKEVIQAAGWIISDDANYDKLGTLSRGGIFSDFDPMFRRVLDEVDTAQALILLRACGIELKSKNIWNDRFYIYENIYEEYPKTKSAFKNLIEELL